MKQLTLHTASTQWPLSPHTKWTSNYNPFCAKNQPEPQTMQSWPLLLRLQGPAGKNPVDPPTSPHWFQFFCTSKNTVRRFPKHCTSRMQVKGGRATTFFIKCDTSIQKRQNKGSVDEAHCCDTSQSLPILIGKQHLVNKGANPHLWSNSCIDQTINIYNLTELASLGCTLWYWRDAYWVLNTHTWENWMCLAVYDAHWRKGRETRHRITTADLSASRLGVHAQGRGPSQQDNDNNDDGHFAFSRASFGSKLMGLRHFQTNTRACRKYTLV